MNKTLILAVFSLFVCASICNKEPVQEPVEFERYVDDYIMHSNVLNTDVYFGVHFPADYDKNTDKRYPVVYMLHGYGDNWKSWNGKYLHANARIEYLEQTGQISDMIYIFPAGFTSYYCNYYTGKYNYMDMFVNEFIPYVDANFRTIADKQHRAITGYSMGGFGAMVLPEKHPELFQCSAPLSMSFRTDDQYMTESQGGWDGQWGAIFGGTGQAGYGRITDYYKQHCPFYQFTPENKEALSGVKWFFTCGDDEEQLLIANDTLHVQLRDLEFPHEFRVGNGAHSSSYWMDALNEVLPWFDHSMNGGNVWPEVSISEVQKENVEFSEDGCVLSVAYTADRTDATGVYFLHKGLSDSFIRDAMAVLYNTNTKVKYVFLPCDLSKKSLEDWTAQYEKDYPQKAKYVVSFGEAGECAASRSEEFEDLIFIDSEFGTDICADTTRSYHFACTDESSCYACMGALYRSCKRSGAKFEYRVLNATQDTEADRLRCLFKLKSYIIY